MYAIRGITISLSIFFILYSAMSVALRYSWRKVWRYAQRHSARSCSNLLFAARMAPAVGAAVATLALALPSFILLEPNSAEEQMSVLPILLACCGVAVLIIGMRNSVIALARASRAVRRWSVGARTVDGAVKANDRVIVLRTPAAAPPITASGILKPTIWLSNAAEIVLNKREMQSALQHELVHVRRHDNLRKLLLRMMAFPGMAHIEEAWHEATEMAADDAAVSSAAEALDLAAAVIKLSRMMPLYALGELTTALVHSPAGSVDARVKRLVEWREPSLNSAGGSSWGYAACVVMIAGLVATYSGLLIRVHEATEWLVR